MKKNKKKAYKGAAAKKVNTAVVMNKTVNKNFNLAFFGALKALSDGLAVTALAALVAHLYFGAGDILTAMALYAAFAVSFLFSVWSRSV